MRKLIVLTLVLFCVSVAAAVELKTKKATVDPQVVLDTWKAEQDASENGYFRFFGTVMTPDEQSFDVVSADRFFNPDENGFPKEVILYYGSRAIYSVIWMEDDIQATFLFCHGEYVQYLGYGPHCPEPKKDEKTKPLSLQGRRDSIYIRAK